MALVKYIRDNIPDTNIGFINDRDYFVNIVPILTGKNTVMINENMVYDNVNIVILNTIDEALIKRISKRYTVILYVGGNISLLPKSKEEKIEIRDDDLFEPEKFYDIFMGYKEPTEDNFYDQIHMKVSKQYEPYKTSFTVDKAFIDNLISFHKGNEKHAPYKTSTLGYIIKDGTVKIDEIVEKEMKKITLKAKPGQMASDERPQVVLDMIQKSLDYSKRVGKMIPNTYLLISISDHNIWQEPGRPNMEFINQIPIMCFAKPGQDLNPLFPETSFGQFSFEEKYDASTSKNWEESVNYIDEKVKEMKLQNIQKENVAYFKGALTGKYLYNIREKLLNLHEKRRSTSILLDNPEGPYTPVYDWYKYDVLLNLPGHHPWSNRLKYLYCLDSYIINVDVTQIKWDRYRRNIEYRNEPYVTFFECFVDSSYSINYNFMYEPTEGKLDRNIDSKVKDLYTFIESTVERLKTDKEYAAGWKSKLNKAKEIIHNLTNDAIYEYISDCIIENSKRIKLEVKKATDFNNLYSVPERPVEFTPENNKDMNVSNVLGWMPYKPVFSTEYFKNFKSGHWGQRKLLLTEILFFTLYGRPNMKVIYAGAAPSDHMLFLSKMFPTYHFTLIDPERWNKEFQKIHPELAGQNFSENTKKYTINDKIDVYHGFMSDQLSRELGEKYKDDNVLFVSDIRPTNIESISSTIQEREAVVKENMEMQSRWYLIIKQLNNKDVYGMFKYKPIFGIDTTEYLDGELYYQPHAPLLSPELRLITNKTTTRKYDNRWLEQHLAWFNRIRRNEENTPLDPRIRGIFDVQYEYDIMKMYVDKFIFSKEKTNKVSPSSDVVGWMKQISEELDNRDYFRGKYLYEKGYVTEFKRMNSWARKIVEKMKKYTEGGIEDD
jgi:hypothetical protein